MIEGTVTADGVPNVAISIAGRQWLAVVDTGFNGDLELPEDLASLLTAEFVGRAASLLAAGQIIEEDVFLVAFPFDGETVTAEATFVVGQEILIGTRLLRQHTLEINFPESRVRIQRA